MKPKRFISEPISVEWRVPPALEKTPTAPDTFTWRDESYEVVQVLSEWVDYERRGRMKRNMQPQHAAVASRRGSWGVGLFYFRVHTSSGQIFDIYYDRSPKNVDTRKGEWFVYQELEENET